MYGNVYEWCRDGYASRLAGGTDPEQSAAISGSGSLRVFRGGGWSASARDCRSGRRGRQDPQYRSGAHGFRLGPSGK